MEKKRKAIFGVLCLVIAVVLAVLLYFFGYHHPTKGVSKAKVAKAPVHALKKQKETKQVPIASKTVQKKAAIMAKAQAKTEAPKVAEEAQPTPVKAEKTKAPVSTPEKQAKTESKVTPQKTATKLAQPAPKAKEKAKPTTHVVKRGEYLWIISGYPQIYGDPRMWPLIYWANKAQIQDPDLIYPGQVLTIPRNVPEEEKERAISFARQRGPWSIFDGK